MDKEGGIKIDGKIRRDRKFPVGVMVWSVLLRLTKIIVLCMMLKVDLP